MEQLALFQDELMLMNDAAAALKALRLDEALAALKNYTELYPGCKDVARKFRIASFFKEGFSAAPPAGPDLAPHLFRLWRSFETFYPSLPPGDPAIGDLKRPFFQKIVAAIEAGRLSDGAFLAEGIPVGYAYLQSGEYERAIPSLQACLITTPDNARIYGYLADAYLLRGEQAVARQVYFEACLIDPAALDWDQLRDDRLTDLLGRLPEEHDCEPSLACAWLPAYAYVQGLFQPKQIRLLEEFKTFTGEYLDLKKTCTRAPSPILAARLFLKGIVLCDNEPFLRLVKGIDFAEVRREMKAANAALFAAYLKQIDRRKPRGL